MRHRLSLLVVVCLGVVKAQLQIVSYNEHSHIFANCPTPDVIPCSAPADCSSELEGAECVFPTTEPTMTTATPEGTCQCPEGEFIHECSLKRCVRYPDSFEGSICQELDHCKHVAVNETITWVKCDKLDLTYGSCICSDLAVRHYDPIIPRDKCIGKVWDMNGICEIDEQCTSIQMEEGYNGVECQPLDQNNPTLGGTCQCTDRALEIDDKCWRIVTDEVTPCTHPEQCDSFDNTQCKGRGNGDPLWYCGCTPDYVDIAEDIGINCQPVRTEEGLPCIDNIQCSYGMGTYARCQDNYCKCSGISKYYDVAGNIKCFIPKALNQTCINNEECLVGVGDNSMCRNNTGRCDCVANTIDWEGGCYLQKKVGDGCRRHEECRVPINGNVKCDEKEKLCICEVDNVPDFGGTVCRSGSRSSRMEFNFVVVAMFAIAKFFV